MGLEIIRTPVELVCYWKDLVKKQQILLDKAKDERERLITRSVIETYQKCADQLDHLLSSVPIEKDGHIN